MELYTKKDLSTFEDKIKDVIIKIEDKKLDIYEPTRKTRMEINKIIFDFIKENRRKIYGGYAQNKLVELKDSDDAFYDPHNIKSIDIDFYSTDPIIDLMKLCNIFYDKGYKNIQGKQAFHGETYSIFIDYENVADISYVPKNIFHRMPFIEINGIHYTHPSFVMIDMYREYTEPYFSSRRWEKTFPRVYVIQKHYPFRRYDGVLNETVISGKVDEKTKNNKAKLLNSIHKFINNKKSLIVFGFYAYNYLLNESGILKEKNNKHKKNLKILDLPCYEFVSTDYIKDATDLVTSLKKQFPELSDSISIVEHYPFWAFTGYSLYVYYKDSPIAYIVDYNSRCTPFKDVISLYFENNNIKKDTGMMRIGSYPYIILMCLVKGFRARVEKDDEKYKFYNIMLTHLIDIRNYFLDKNNKTLLDDTLFQEFLPYCTGDMPDPMKEVLMKRQRRFQERKVALFKYEPESGKKEPETTYKFPNSSGNAIRKTRNLKVFRIAGDLPRTREDDDDDNDEEDNQNNKDNKSKNANRKLKDAVPVEKIIEIVE